MLTGLTRRDEQAFCGDFQSIKVLWSQLANVNSKNRKRFMSFIMQDVFMLVNLERRF